MGNLHVASLTVEDRAIILKRLEVKYVWMNVVLCMVMEGKMH